MNQNKESKIRIKYFKTVIIIKSRVRVLIHLIPEKTPFALFAE